MVYYTYLIFLLATLTTFHVSTTTTPPPLSTTAPPPPLSTTAREFLETHNQARASVGVEPLTWSEQLANTTNKLVRYQRDRLTCQFAKLAPGKYGANQLMARGAAVTPRMVVDEWVKEKQFYNHSNNSCVPNHRCGVYTQVVWRKSVEVGCAQTVCGKEEEEETSLTICFYYPPGNYVGETPY